MGRRKEDVINNLAFSNEMKGKFHDMHVTIFYKDHNVCKMKETNLFPNRGDIHMLEISLSLREFVII